MIRTRILSLVLLLSSVLHLFGSYLDLDNAVVVIVPVADAIGRPLQSIDSSRPVEELYDNLSFSPQEGPNSCPRLHQFVQNQVGRQVGSTPDGKEIEVEFPDGYYENEKREKCNRFWLPAKNVMPLKKIKEQIGSSLFYIPEPIKYFEPYDQRRFDDILTLIMPWKNPDTGIVYSVRTRFRRAYLDAEKYYQVYILDPVRFEVKVAYVDKEKALVDYPRDYASAKKLFVEILRKLAAFSPAYVWGGCSCVESCKSGEFTCMAAKRGNDDLKYWVRPFIPGTHTGLDCSGLITCAARAAGLIGYSFTNTTTLAYNLKDLEDGGAASRG